MDEYPGCREAGEPYGLRRMRRRIAVVLVVASSLLGTTCLLSACGSDNTVREFHGVFQPGNVRYRHHAYVWAGDLVALPVAGGRIPVPAGLSRAGRAYGLTEDGHVIKEQVYPVYRIRGSRAIAIPTLKGDGQGEEYVFYEKFIRVRQ